MLFVEGKDVSETVDVADLLEELVGSEVQIKSVSSVGA
jgi:DNA-binding protein